MVTEAERAHASSQHGGAWKFNPSMRSQGDLRPSLCSVQQAENKNSPEERVKIWFNHFSQLFIGIPDSRKISDQNAFETTECLGSSRSCQIYLPPSLKHGLKSENQMGKQNHSRSWLKCCRGPFLFIVALDYSLRCPINGREEELFLSF